MKFLSLSILLLLLSACNIPSEQKLEFNPDYNRIARNATVVQKASNFVTYEYKNIRVDELAAVASIARIMVTARQCCMISSSVPTIPAGQHFIAAALQMINPRPLAISRISSYI